MKTIVMTDDDGTLNRIKINVRDKRYTVADTTNAKDEYLYLVETIHGFSKSDYDILILKFSGNESIRKKIGDESSEMIISLSSNKNSLYYLENPENVFSKLIKA